MDWNFSTIILSILDILIMAFVIYKILMLLKDSRAMQLLKGVLILFVAYIVSGWINLTTVHWILDKSWSLIVLGIAIIFQPELRNALEKLGRSNPLFSGTRHHSAMFDTAAAVEKAIWRGSSRKVGMLLVLQGSTGLKQQIETGVAIDARISTELLLNLFFKNSPLHDGAVVIKGNRVVAAGCIMPLTTNTEVDSSLGTRHRAAIGVSEMSDALVLVVSEETGAVSMVNRGVLRRKITPGVLRRALDEYFGVSGHRAKGGRRNHNV